MDTSDSKRMERLLVSVDLDEKQNERKNSKTSLMPGVIRSCAFCVQGGIVSRQTI
jgi:hypothetical protein